MHTYTVVTRCVADLTEEWTITSETPLSEDQIAEVVGSMLDDFEARGINLEFNEQQTDNERDRVVESVKEVLPA